MEGVREKQRRYGCPIDFGLNKENAEMNGLRRGNRWGGLGFEEALEVDFDHAEAEVTQRSPRIEWAGGHAALKLC